MLSVLVLSLLITFSPHGSTAEVSHSKLKYPFHIQSEKCPDWPRTLYSEAVCAACHEMWSNTFATFNADCKCGIDCLISLISGWQAATNYRQWLLAKCSYNHWLAVFWLLNSSFAVQSAFGTISSESALISLRTDRSLSATNALDGIAARERPEFTSIVY